MRSSKCLAILARSMMRPTARPMAAARRSRPRSTRTRIRSSPRSVDASSASRLRARSAAKAGLRHTMRRSPGKSGLLISARSRSSKRPSWSEPSSTRPRMAGALKALIQSMPPRSRRRSMRALVSMPRSPASTKRSSPKRPWSASSRSSRVAGSAVFPGKASTLRGRPSASSTRPNTTWLAVGPMAPAVAVGRERAGATGDIRAGHVVEHQRATPEVPRHEVRLDGVLAGQQPVERPIQLVLAGVAHPEAIRQRGVGEAPGGGELGRGVTDAGHEHGHHQRRCPTGTSPQQRLEPQPAGHAQDRRHVAVGQAGADLQGPVRGGQRGRVAGQRARTSSMTGEGRCERLASVRCFTPAVLAVALADEVVDVLAVLVRPHDFGHMHRAGLLWCHARIIAHLAIQSSSFMATSKRPGSPHTAISLIG